MGILIRARARVLSEERRASLADQLQRAATSIPLNIADGAGEFSASEKARFYRMAQAFRDRVSRDHARL